MIEEIKKILCPRVPWAFFIREEDISQVGPLLYCHIKEQGLESDISAQILEKLEKTYNDTMARNLIFLEELKKILKVLSKEKIEIILLKGVALITEGIYSNPALRPIADIDLLVHPSDFPFLKTILNNIGYDDIAWGPEDFIKEVNGVLIDVDVHTNLINITRLPSRAKICDININELWKNARRIEIDEVDTLILSPPDFLINLAVHSVIHHGMSGPLWFLDIINFLEYHKDIDWNEVIAYARKNRTNKFLYYTLRYINEILKMDISKDIIEKLRPEKIGLAENRIFKRILNGKNNPYDKFFFAFSSIEGITDKLLFLKETILPPLKFLQARYNAKGNFGVRLSHFSHLLKVMLNVKV